MNKQFVVFDTEIIGKKKPVFLIGVKYLTTGLRVPFWFHKKGHMKAFEKLLFDQSLTWVGFNSENFDRPLISVALSGKYGVHEIKELATTIVTEGMHSWQTYKEFDLDFLEYDHIDLFDVAPGVMTSLKTYMGRIGHPTMIDLPFHHDEDLSPKQQAVLEHYCLNDLDGTEALFTSLKEEIDMRYEMSAEHGIDLRSKSDAQIAEAILKKKVGIKNGDKVVPSFVRYTTPDFIKTRNPVIKELIELLNDHEFTIYKVTGSPNAPEFLEEPVDIGSGSYQMGVGGLHSIHDKNLYLEASDLMLISDFDVGGYYPKIMMKAGLIPRLGGNKGALFLQAYQEIYETRIEAKRKAKKLKEEMRGLRPISAAYKKLKPRMEHEQKLANSLKITLNGTFGKLGNIYCSFYSPDLMLAVTLTGQLNLLCLIDELEKIKGVVVRSANTDGLVVTYAPALRERVLKVFSDNAKRTDFEYEEAQYKKYAAKDVNNYIAVKTNDEVKCKGLYAETSLMKNPTMEVCVKAVKDYLLHGIEPKKAITKYKDMKDFVAIRNVKGGGIQFEGYKLVDDWMEVEPGKWRRPEWSSIKASVKRKSRPAPVEVGVGGKPFGRVARWYMTVEKLPPLSYIGSGNKVPKTDGAKVCMTLPDKLPADLDLAWYIKEAHEILCDIGCLTV